MNHKIYQQLKDAGFPQGMGNYLLKNVGEKEYRKFRITDEHGYENLLAAGYDMFFIPTLEELIKKCNGYICLLKTKTLWLAFWKKEEFQRPVGLSAIDIFMEISEEGKTPFEVVAKLWLKLNAK